MGVTVSHSTLAPISLVSTIIGFISFGFTLGTFFNVFWSSIVTIKNAPNQITDYLSSLKEGLLEERHHLRRVRRRLRKWERPGDTIGRGPGFRRPSRGGGGGGMGAGSGGSRSQSRGRKKRHSDRAFFERDIQSFRSAGEDAALRTQRIAVRDMIRQSRAIEYPFLRPELQNQTSIQWSATPTYSTSYPPNHDGEKHEYTAYDDDDYGPEGNMPFSSARFGSEYRICGLRERWVWLRRKSDVISLSEGLSRVETRRIAHETTEVLMAISDIGRDLEDMREGMAMLEGRLSRVVGVRRVD
ncbi:hypothetical protein B0J11DRAFT_610129 [Dendryphion nanum]|uniref:Uncharacterized protein n=1 Tax=Dendryphion nanum TaxID=256645 RepID=A0A9P9EK77_9PLEO|nr:hypothetical protein B0J11DRAFT_610129 [Dendryphion nanum]